MQLVISALRLSPTRVWASEWQDPYSDVGARLSQLQRVLPHSVPYNTTNGLATQRFPATNDFSLET